MSNLNLLFWWQWISSFPFGDRIFSFCLGLLVPYTRSIRCRVLRLAEGFAEVEMKDRWFLHNHLSSIHAASMANLMELTAHLALMTRLPSEYRCILTTLSINYIKKARGTLIAECMAAAPQIGNYQCKIIIRDANGDKVAEGKCFFKISPMSGLTNLPFTGKNTVPISKLSMA